MCDRVISELRAQALSGAACEEIEAHAYAVNDKISDGGVRNLHVLYAI